MHSRELWRARYLTSSLDIVILAVAVIPLCLTRYLPLSDLPNHLAVQYVLQDLTSSAALQKFYYVHYQLVPNLALGIFVYFTSHIVSIDIAVRLFCIATIIVLFIGTQNVGRQLCNEPSYAYRAVPLLAYGGPFQFGFLNYCFGIGVALILFGLYLRERCRSLPVLMAIFVPGGIVLLLCHIAAFGIYAIGVSCFELGESWRLRSDDGLTRLMANVIKAETKVTCHLLPPLLLFVVLGPHGGPLGLVWGSVHQKLAGIAAITLFSSPWQELALLALAGTGFTAALLAGLIRIEVRAIPILAGLSLIWILLPRSGFGGGYIDYRVPWATTFFLVAAIEPGHRDSGRARTVLVTTVAVLVAWRIALIGDLWLGWEPIIAGIDYSLTALPIGTPLMVVIGRPTSTSASRSPTLLQVAAYAVARRQAFEPNIYAGISGQVLRLQPRYQALRLVSAPVRLTRIDPVYTYLLVLRPRDAQLSPSLPLTLVTKGRLFELYRVKSEREIHPHKTAR